MFTVIILGERAQGRVERWRGLFDPFVRSGAVALCDWNQAASVRTLKHAVPELASAIKGKRDWRAVVVDLGPEDVGSTADADPENPFDYLDNHNSTDEPDRPKEELNLEESPHPVVRLSHMLLGYPEIGTKAFQADPSYRDRDSALRIHESEFLERQAKAGADLTEAAARFRASLVTERDVQVHYREIAYEQEEVARHQALTELYRVRHVRPFEVVFLTTREPVEATGAEHLRKAWHVVPETGPSRFVERNDYPASCRFGVYDLHPAGSSGAELDELSFWLTVLSIATNELPPSAFQAEHVYRVGLEIDEPALGALLNEHLGRLAGVREHLDTVLRRPERSHDKPLEEILQKRHVALSFETLRGDEISVGTSGFGLASDVPRSDSSRWDNSYRELRHRLDEFVRKPRRVLARAVETTREQTQSFVADDVTLTGIEREELREELLKRTRQLTEPATLDILNRPRLQRILDGHSERIREAMSERMRLRTIYVASAVVLVAWFGAFVPYLLRSWSLGVSAISEALALVLLILGILCGVCVGVLVLLRYRMVSRIRALNRDLKAFVLGVNTGAGAFGEYLGALATYMYGRSVLMADVRRNAKHQRRLRGYAHLRKRVADRIDSEKEIVLGLGMSVQVERTREGFVDFDMESPEVIRTLFEWPPSRRSAKLNHSGDLVRAPFDFVQRIAIERLPVRERVVERQALGGAE